jgi:hypothetical protein
MCMRSKNTGLSDGMENIIFDRGGRKGGWVRDPCCSTYVSVKIGLGFVSQSLATLGAGEAVSRFLALWP